MALQLPEERSRRVSEPNERQIHACACGARDGAAFAGIDIEGDFLDHLGSKLIASVRGFDFEEVGDKPECARLRLH